MGTVDPEDPHEPIEALVDHLAHLLPGQGPISVFVHHNTLHAFEDRPFERAVVEAAALFGCEPYLSTGAYRDAISEGRITDADLEAVLDEEAQADAPVGGVTTRRAIRLLVLRHGLPEATGQDLRWLLSETDALSSLRADAPAAARIRLHGDPPTSEAAAAKALWDACLSAVSPLAPPPAPAPAEMPRHRDLLLAATGVDTDSIVHPVLIRLCAAWLDQGLAYWTMPDRDRGLWGSVCSVYGGARFVEPWLTEAAAELSGTGEPAAVVTRSLADLGVEAGERQAFLTPTLLALRGFGGMVRQLEERPDRAPTNPLPARVMDLLALRLVLERHALAHVARETLGFCAPLASLRAHLRAVLPPPVAPTVEERAWLLFQLAQLLGLPAPRVQGMSPGDVAALLAELDGLPSLERRRLLHLAYEKSHATMVLDGLAVHTAHPPHPPPPAEFQVIACIDDREESLRRHLEELAPSCETFGVAGFFGVAMYFRGAADARPRPLCPITVRPDHQIGEEVDEGLTARAGRRERARRLIGGAAISLRVSSRTLARGSVLTAVLGLAAAVPLVLRVLFPRLVSAANAAVAWVLRPASRSRLALDRQPEATPVLGAHVGFTVEEMAGMVRRLLEDIGLTRRLSRLVLVLGHGSSSVNNPHLSAYECGACGGNGGGPNARAFAQMANDARVRAMLSTQGLAIPPETHFLGAFHDTCRDAIAIYDEERIPATHREAVAQLHRVLDQARARNAHERSRRFESAPSWFPPGLALAHVEGRASDLAQPRPEYGHSTNAVAIIGRRERTRALFLDRRAFLVSYDPTTDADRSILARVLAAVVPVGVGINLEYWFSRVDPTGYGCGTKLPHNLTGMIGVMDGHSSDLRTGLTWQMVEIHEPVRLLVIVEVPPEDLLRVVADNPSIERLVRNRWIRVATLAPDGAQLHVLGPNGFEPYAPSSRRLPIVPASADWYRGHRDHLRCARTGPLEVSL